MIHLHRKLDSPDKHYSAAVVKAKDHVDRVLSNLGALEESILSIKNLRFDHPSEKRSLTIHGDFDSDRYREDCVRNYRVTISNVGLAIMALEHVFSSLYYYFKLWQVPMPKYRVPGDLTFKSLPFVSQSESVEEVDEEEEEVPSFSLEFELETEATEERLAHHQQFVTDTRKEAISQARLKVDDKLQRLLLLPGPAIFISGIAGAKLRGHPSLKAVQNCVTNKNGCASELMSYFSIAVSLGMGKIMYVC